MMRKIQKGMSVTLLIFLLIILVVGGIIGAQIVPLYIEYYTILKNAKISVTQVPANGTKDQVRDFYERKTEIDYTTAVPASDIEITKDGQEWVISFAYTKKLHLVANAYLFFDFQGSSAGEGLSGTKGTD